MVLFANSLKNNKKHIQLINLVVLIGMLKVGFPIGEYFHHHQSDAEVCTQNSKQKCTHKTHFSAIKYHSDCIFHQLHPFFDGIFYGYYIHTIYPSSDIAYFTKDYTFIKSIFTPSRAPPTRIG